MSFPAPPTPPPIYVPYPFNSVSPSDDDNLPVFGGTNTIALASDGNLNTLWQPEGDPTLKTPPAPLIPGNWFSVTCVLTLNPAQSLTGIQIACPTIGSQVANVIPTQLAIFDDPLTMNLVYSDPAPVFVPDVGLGISFYTGTFNAVNTTKPVLYFLQAAPAALPSEVTFELNEFQFFYTKPYNFPTPIRSRRVPGRRVAAFKFPGRKKARFMSYQAVPQITENVT